MEDGIICHTLDSTEHAVSIPYPVFWFGESENVTNEDLFHET